MLISSNRESEDEEEEDEIEIEIEERGFQSHQLEGEVDQEEEDNEDEHPSALEESLSLMSRLIKLGPRVQQEIVGDQFVANMARGTLANLRQTAILAKMAVETYLLQGGGNEEEEE